LRTTLEENLAMIRDTVEHLLACGQRVFVDAEHFFDGYRANRAYALEVLTVAAGRGQRSWRCATPTADAAGRGGRRGA
jgi:2-isopropylmalate synthase